MIEGKVEIAGAVLSSDGSEFLLYFPEGEGSSCPVDRALYEQLRFITHLVKTQLSQEASE